MSASQLGGEHFAGGEGAIAIACDGINGVVDGVGKMFGETCGFAPAHAVEGEDIGEGVAEEENVRAGVRAPESGAAGNLFKVRGFLETRGGCGIDAEHGDEVALVRALAGDGGGGIWGRAWGDAFGDGGCGKLHGLRGPVSVGTQVEVGVGVRGLVGEEEGAKVERGNSFALEGLNEALRGKVFWVGTGVAGEMRGCDGAF